MPSSVGGPALNNGAFPAEAPVDRSAFGLAIQKDQLNYQARGSALGQGRRVAPDPKTLFSTPISSSQFGGGGSAKATFTKIPEEQ